MNKSPTTMCAASAFKSMDVFKDYVHPGFKADASVGVFRIEC